MNCTKCECWNKGHGQKACLKCKQYKQFTIEHTKRQSIKIVTVPDEILESIPDTISNGLMDAIKSLPLELSTIVMQHYLIGATHQEIADQLKLDRSTITKKIKFALDIIKKSL